jgi:hypothetical protein
MVSNNFSMETKGGGFSKGLKGQLSFSASAQPTIAHCHSDWSERSLTNPEIMECFFTQFTLSSRKVDFL